MKKLLLLIVCVLLTGCASVNKQRFRAEQFYKEHPNELAEKCATNFPPTYKEGKTITLPSDTVYVKGDSVKCPDIINKTTGEVIKGGKAKCPDSKTIYVPQLRVDTIESTATLAKVADLTYKLSEKSNELIITQDKLNDALKTAKNRLWYLIGLIIIIFGYVGIKTYLKFKI
jgi:hypothetical protein